MRYWHRVATRAATEAAKDSRLGGVSVAALIIGQLILGLVLFEASGYASANLPTRVVSALLPLLIFPAFFAFRMTTVPPALDAERKGQIADLEKKIEDRYWAAIGGEDAKRHAILNRFRELYKLSTDGLSPELIAGLAWPPIEWLNEKLDNSGESWQVDRIEGERVFTKELPD